MQAGLQRKQKSKKHCSLGHWCHSILKCCFVFEKKKKENWHKKYVVLCYPVLYISWNPRCRVQEKSSSRGNVSPQCSRSGKTIRWNRREETRSKLFPLFFSFLSIILRKGFILLGVSQQSWLGRKQMTIIFRVHLCIATEWDNCSCIWCLRVIGSPKKCVHVNVDVSRCFFVHNRHYTYR